MMISCEENPPYGPSKDTAVMFLELFCQAYEKKWKRSVLSKEVLIRDREQQYSLLAECNYYLTIRITIYHAQSNDYPLTSSEWSSYDGILIPGSLSASAAYDNTSVEWILDTSPAGSGSTSTRSKTTDRDGYMLILSCKSC